MTTEHGPGGKFSVEVKKRNAPAVVAVRGEIDLATAPQLKQALMKLLDESKTAVVDLSETSYVDSTGLGVLIGGLKRARELGGDLKLAGLVPRVRRVFAITRIGKVFEIYPSVEEALMGKQDEGGATP